MVVSAQFQHLEDLRSAVRRLPDSGPLSTFRVELLRLIDVRATGVLQSEAPAPPVDRRVRQALARLEELHARPALKLGDVAAHLRLSRYHLGRILMTHTGLGFRDHLREARVRNASRLLATTSLEIKEIAAAVGYTQAAQFCRHFKRVAGVSPGAFRRACTAGDQFAAAATAVNESHQPTSNIC